MIQTLTIGLLLCHLKVASKLLDPGTHSVVFNGENLPFGMYTVKITSGASSEEMKVVLSK